MPLLLDSIEDIARMISDGIVRFVPSMVWGIGDARCVQNVPEASEEYLTLAEQRELLRHDPGAGTKLSAYFICRELVEYTLSITRRRMPGIGRAERVTKRS